ncbi:MAG TPA: MerR family transcriptional regulator [Roseiarcus sp.]|jgi:DNA-binding transcriptional MerR regulator
MDKSPDAFRTISEVAEGLALPQHVLRFWETRFPQIKPLKRGGGRRYYRPEDIELLAAIKRLLYGEGYTIKGVQKLLKEQGAAGLVRSTATAPGPIARPPRAPAAPRERSEPPLRAETVAAPPVPAPAPRPALGSGELAALRALLEDLREAERILARARSA